MPALNNGNSSIDKSSGAVIYHKSPELLEIIKLSKKVDSLEQKIDKILSLLEGGDENGTKVERPGQCEDNDQKVQ